MFKKKKNVFLNALTWWETMRIIWKSKMTNPERQVGIWAGIYPGVSASPQSPGKSIFMGHAHVHWK